MKYTLLSLFTFLSIVAFGQDVAVEPSPYVEEFYVDLTDYYSEPIAHAKIANYTAGEVSLKWELEVVDAPAEWEYRICDNNACYSTMTSTNYNPPTIEEPTLISAGDTSLLDVHVLPRQVAGTGTVKIKISYTDDPDNVVAEGTFEITVIGDPSSTTEINKSAIDVFPNPALDYITLSDATYVDQIVIFNTIGKPVLTFDVDQTNTYRVADLPNGLYLISLVNNDEGILRTIRLMKRSVNP